MRFLVVDDSEDDRFQIRRLLGDVVPRSEVVELADGDEVMPYLELNGSVDVIFLDLRMIRMSGLEVLPELLSSSFRSIPVIVLTTSDDEDDVNEAYRHKVALYLRKPADIGQLAALFHALEDFAVRVIRLPSGRA